jgi:hypothetical protein
MFHGFPGFGVLDLILILVLIKIQDSNIGINEITSFPTTRMLTVLTNDNIYLDITSTTIDGRSNILKIVNT